MAITLNLSVTEGMHIIRSKRCLKVLVAHYVRQSKVEGTDHAFLKGVL